MCFLLIGVRLLIVTRDYIAELHLDGCCLNMDMDLLYSVLKSTKQCLTKLVFVHLCLTYWRVQPLLKYCVDMKLSLTCPVERKNGPVLRIPAPTYMGRVWYGQLRVVPLRRGRAQGFAGCQKSSQPSPGPLPANLRCHLSRLGCALGAAATWFQSPEPWSKGWSACGANAKALTITDKVIASCYIYVKYIFITISYTYIYI